METTGLWGHFNRCPPVQSAGGGRRPSIPICRRPHTRDRAIEHYDLGDEIVSTIWAYSCLNILLHVVLCLVCTYLQPRAHSGNPFANGQCMHHLPTTKGLSGVIRYFMQYAVKTVVTTPHLLPNDFVSIQSI